MTSAERRKRFRDFMARLSNESSESPAFYVHPPHAVSDSITASLELDSSIRHLIVGGIGSGKTTQLKVAATRIDAHADIDAHLVDVSLHQDLTKLRPGCLVALAGLALIERHGHRLDQRDSGWFKEWAHGHLIDPGDWEPDEPEVMPGVVTPPALSWPDIPNYHVNRLHTFQEAIGDTSQVVLFDSLDRTNDLKAFAGLVAQDVAALHSCKIGVVLIGPLRSLEGFARLDVERFDRLHFQGALDPSNTENLNFLFRVLRARADDTIISSEAAMSLVVASGGVLRDLLALSKAAVEDAYLRGAESVTPTHAAGAIDAFGRSLMIGLGSEEVETLRHLNSGKGFVATSEDDLALIATRRVLEYRTDSTPRFSVHPAISSLLSQKASS